MHIHILGISGTFMAGIALLAKEQGHHVTGADKNNYPPMGSQLKEKGIKVIEGYHPNSLPRNADVILIGNTMKRGDLIIESLLNEQLPYTSGPQWLAENILHHYRVIAVAGTHGKTTTSSLLAHLLEEAGEKPGFLIGGIPQNFGFSARLGKNSLFVIEADEYDTAFFDKRSKFLHYRPELLIMNNLEYDHADIFPNLAAIQTQFHQLVRTLPGNGIIVIPKKDKNLQAVLTQGCWTPIQTFGEGGEWQSQALKPDYSGFTVYHQKKFLGEIQSPLLGEHNMNNVLAATAIVHALSIPFSTISRAIKNFKGIKRRLEIRGKIRGITIYDDFAHHPTAIASTLFGLRKHVGKQRIFVILELGSYTMRTGHHQHTLGPALECADKAWIYLGSHEASFNKTPSDISIPYEIAPTIESIIEGIKKEAQATDHILIMSNTGFSNIHDKLIKILHEH